MVTELPAVWWQLRDGGRRYDNRKSLEPATAATRLAVLHREAFTPGRGLPFQRFFDRAFRLGCSYPRSTLVVQP
jgi:hypothetical protein